LPVAGDLEQVTPERVELGHLIGEGALPSSDLASHLAGCRDDREARAGTFLVDAATFDLEHEELGVGCALVQPVDDVDVLWSGDHDAAVVGVHGEAERSGRRLSPGARQLAAEWLTELFEIVVQLACHVVDLVAPHVLDVDRMDEADPWRSASPPTRRTSPRVRGL